MSANNQIIISRKDNTFTIKECDADTGHVNQDLGVTSSLGDAIRKANRYMKKNEVEYGISFSNI